MTCSQARRAFSPYLDGAVPGTQMQALSSHLETCASCRWQYASLQASQQLLARLGKRKAPADLALRLRVAISREAAKARQPLWTGLQLRIENAVDAFMVPAMAGLVSAVVVFALLMGFVALPAPLRAGNPDVPLMLNTAPELQESAFGTSVDSLHDESLVIEAYVDSNGRVQDYRVLSDPREAKDLPPQVKTMLVNFMTFTRFRPATYMGIPTSGRAVLSFSKVSVRG